MVRRLTDTYFVEYTMEISGLRVNGVEQISEKRDGRGIFVISEHDLSIIIGIKRILNLQLIAEYNLYDEAPHVSDLTIIDIRPL